jgi:hypothetical protein
LTVKYITPNGNDPVYSVTLKNKKLANYEQVFIGVGVLIGVFGLSSALALVFTLAPLSYRKKIKERLGFCVVSTTRQGRNMMTTGSRQFRNTMNTGSRQFRNTMTTGSRQFRNTMTTGSRQYLNIASPNESETCSITINPANVDALNDTDNNKKMTTNVKKIIIKKNNKKMTSKYNAVYVKGKLVEKNNALAV